MPLFASPRYSSLLLLLTFVAPSPALAANAITLKASPNPGQVQQKIMLTASVTNNGVPARRGTVTFFSAKTLLGSVQVVGNQPAPGYKTGDAVLTTMLAPGPHNLTAVYGGTASFPDVVKSNVMKLKVNGTIGTLTSLAAQANNQNPQNYDFTATTSAFGFRVPSGSVDFTDITTSTDLGAAGIDPESKIHTFLKAAITPAPGPPAQSVVADFNGDGIPDIATANAASGPSTMAVFLGTGAGSFQAPVSYPTGVFTSGIIAGDFNRDGIPDLAAMSQGSGSDGDVAVFLGNGDGSFQASKDAPLATFPVAIAVGDFDHDGVLDFATVDSSTGFVSVSLGNGNGNFQAPVAYRAGSGPVSLAVADFNGDNYDDLAVVNKNGGTLSVLLNNGDGTFQDQVVYLAGNQVAAVTTGDLNRDGKLDIVVANYADFTVGVFLNRGDGIFTTQSPYSVSGHPAGVALADTDGDGILDIVATYSSSGKIGVLHGKGNGIFSGARNFSTRQTQGFQLSIADINGDGTPDVISDDLDSSLSVLLNVIAVRASITDIAVPGNPTDKEKIVATYGGDSRYNSSVSKPVVVHGSGAN